MHPIVVDVKKKEARHVRLPIVVLILVITYCSMLVAPAWSQSSSAGTQEGTTASGAGMQAAAGLATVFYLPFKAAFAIGGGIVGGLAYLFSGLNEPTAKSIWVPSMYGTYVITPEHLSGDRPVRFLGVAAENEGTSVAPAPAN